MRVLLVGRIRKNGLAMAAALRSHGIECEILLPTDQIEQVFGRIPGQFPDWIRVYDSGPQSLRGKFARRFSLVSYLARFDVVHSRCLGVLGRQAMLRLLGKPYVEHTVGSDMRELAVAPGETRKKVVEHYRRAAHVFVGQNDHLTICEQLGLTNYSFLPFIIDSESYFPDSERFVFPSREFVVFHPAHNDWTYRHGDRAPEKGNDKYRNSSKGNDRLIRGFARLVRTGCRGLLIMLERGVDVAESKDLVCDLGIDEYVRWLPPMSSDELRRYYSSVDVVVDQFEVGTLGLISLDAMACGATVVTYLDETTATMAYGELPPIVNCRDENDILRSLSDLASSGRDGPNYDARRWVLAHHGPEKVTRCLLRAYGSVCG